MTAGPGRSQSGEKCIGMTRQADELGQQVSVVICAFTDERFERLVAAVRSLQNQTVRPAEIVIAVDHNPRLLERVRHELPEVIAVDSTRQRGAGGARNAGVAASTGQILAFIDDDAQAAPDWLERLLPAFAQPNVLGCGGSIEPVWPPTGRPHWFPAEFDWVIGCTYRGLPSRPRAVRNVISANMAVRREVFDELGGFRVDFGKQGTRSEPEDTEFCIRASKHWPERVWMYVPEAVVHHTVSLERTRWRYFFERCVNEGRGKARMRSLSTVPLRLEVERSYVTRTLPTGIFQGLARGTRGDRRGFLCAATIIGGLSVTAIAYARELVVVQSGSRCRPRATLPEERIEAKYRDAFPWQSGATKLHRLASALCRSGVPVLPRLIDATSLVLFGAGLPARLQLPAGVFFAHNGHGTVVHAEVRFRGPALVLQGVTIGESNGGRPGVPEIGSHVLLGARCAVLGGVRVGDFAIVGPGAVVTRDVPAGHGAYGNPARIKPLPDPARLAEIFGITLAATSREAA